MNNKAIAMISAMISILAAPALLVRRLVGRWRIEQRDVEQRWRIEQRYLERRWRIEQRYVEQQRVHRWSYRVHVDDADLVPGLPRHAHGRGGRQEDDEHVRRGQR